MNIYETTSKLSLPYENLAKHQARRLTEQSVFGGAVCKPVQTNGCSVGLITTVMSVYRTIKIIAFV